jgi:hypothetical protein
MRQQWKPHINLLRCAGNTQVVSGGCRVVASEWDAAVQMLNEKWQAISAAALVPLPPSQNSTCDQMCARSNQFHHHERARWFRNPRRRGLSRGSTEGGCYHRRVCSRLGAERRRTDERNRGQRSVDVALPTTTWPRAEIDACLGHATSIALVTIPRHRPSPISGWSTELGSHQTPREAFQMPTRLWPHRGVSRGLRGTLLQP